MKECKLIINIYMMYWFSILDILIDNICFLCIYIYTFGYNFKCELYMQKEYFI